MPGLSSIDGSLDGPLGLVGGAGHIEVSRQPDQRLAKSGPVVQVLVAPHRLLGEGDGLVESARVVELPSIVVEQAGMVGRPQPLGVAQRDLEVCQRLPVRPQSPGFPACGRRERRQGLTVVGLYRVVHEPIQVPGLLR